ncbi:MAG: hypothetical protein ABJJ03_03215, partial [Sulfitobacter sp.]
KSALARIATATGQPKANGPWKEAEIEAQTHATRHADLDRACAELSRALSERHQVAKRLAMLEAPGAQEALEKAVETAQKTHDAALAHADKVAQADAQAALRQLELESAQRALDGLIMAQEQHGVAKDQHETATRAQAAAAQAVQTAQEATQAAEARVRDAAEMLAKTASEKEAAQQDALRQSLAEKHARAQELLTQVEQKRARLESVQAATATLLVTAPVLAEIEAAQATLTRAQSEAAAGGVQIILNYSGTARVSHEGAALDAGTHQVSRPQAFDLPGIGRLEIDPAAACVDTGTVTSAQTRLDHVLAAVNMADLPAARAAALARKGNDDEIALLKNVLATLAPSGVEALQAEVAQARAKLDALCDAAGAPNADPEVLSKNHAAAQRGWEDAQAAYDRSRDARDAAAHAAAHAQAQLSVAQTAFERAAVAFGDPMSFETRKTTAARAHSVALVAAQDSQAAAQNLRDDAPDLAMAQADLTRAKSAAGNARDERSQLQTRSADLSATIRTRAEDGVEEKRDEAAGLMRAAKDRAAKLAHEAAGLSLLLGELQAKRGAAQEAYFGPVQQELAPLLALLHADAALSFDPTSLLPQGIARGGTDETMESLSGGTQEQIAILTRLAFARLFARQGKPMPVILDDALVYSDDSRIIAMFNALHRVAHDQQVIVFSCRQMAFAELGGTKPQITITDQ